MITFFKILYILAMTGFLTSLFLLGFIGVNLSLVLAVLCFMLVMYISAYYWDKALLKAGTEAEIKFLSARDKAVRKAMEDADKFLNS